MSNNAYLKYKKKWDELPIEKRSIIKTGIICTAVGFIVGLLIPMRYKK